MISNCVTCGQSATYVDCPTGGWWAHLTHPADGHDADVWGYTTWPTTPAVDWTDLVGPYIGEHPRPPAVDWSSQDALQASFHAKLREIRDTARSSERQDANDEARSQLTDDEHDPRDFDDEGER